ncbi:hypothetical protein ZIOFF_002331 [Zingiber officinale]|uniref:Bowman-Birk serine protease inhibitors family domain-containing protein n=1 Tax=Zingiber officinale TaxID=94328 RepID=A0A8J5IL38_ZINOF|nr:hypothetical protein ZIOFF_002331 [Zingiber officinale]
MKHDLLVLVLALASAAAPAAVLFTTAAAPNTAISELEGQRRVSQLTTIRQASISSGHETGAVAAAATAVAADKTIRVRRTWPCCDRCGGCSINSDLPECQCHDLVRRCHASCRSCVRSPLSVEPPLFQCTDRIPGY